MVLHTRWLLKGVAFLGLAACGAASVVAVTPGDPPLSGTWVPAIGPGYCGVDTPCSFHLRLSGSTVTGAFIVVPLVAVPPDSTPLTGTYASPAVHLQWGAAPSTSTFDGQLVGDTLLVGIQSPHRAGLSDSLTLRKQD